MSEKKSLWNQIQSSVCRDCPDYDKQKCLHGEGLRCALFRNFSRLFSIMSACGSTEKPVLNSSLQSFICRQCPNQDNSGRCVIRNNCDCALDSNFSTVVDIMRPAA